MNAVVFGSHVSDDREIGISFDFFKIGLRHRKQKLVVFSSVQSHHGTVHLEFFRSGDDLRVQRQFVFVDIATEV